MGAILAKAVSIILIIATGYAIKRLGWVSIKDFPKFSKIVLRISLPCALITSFNQFKLESNLLFLVMVGFMAVLIQQLSGYMINRSKGRINQAFSILNIGSYNIGLFGIPYISGFIGTQAIIFCSLYDMGNSIATAGIGYGWSMSLSKDKEKVTFWRFVKLMLSSPVFDTYLILLVMGLLGLRFPDPVITFTSTVGGANTFLAMLMIGIGLELRLEPCKFKKAFSHLGLRYAFATTFTILALFFIPFSKEIKTVLAMLFFAPMASMISGFTSEIGSDVETSAFMTSLSIIVGIVVMPLIFAMMS